MTPSKHGWLRTAFAASFLAVGVPYWTIPSGGLSLPKALMGPALVIVVLAPLVLRATGAATFPSAVLSTAAAVPAAVMARVIVEGVMDPTSHNLWPFEVAIALGVGVRYALVGAIVGSGVALLIKWTSRHPE